MANGELYLGSVGPLLYNTTERAPIQITHGAGAGKILTSDATGKATWADAGTASFDVDVPMLKGITFSYAGAGVIEWSAGTIRFGGTDYPIAAGDVSTGAYVYWNVSAPDTFQCSGTVPVGSGNWILAYFDSGTNTVHSATQYNILHGGLIQAGTVTASQIKAGTITATELSFTPIDGDSIVATINASAEGIKIDADLIQINGNTTFTAGYDPTTKAKTFVYADATTPPPPYAIGDIWSTGFHPGTGFPAVLVCITAKASGQSFSQSDWVVRGDKTSDNIAAGFSGQGALATQDAVSAAMLDSTVIVGGYIKTSLLSADNIQTGTLTGRTVQTASSGTRVVISSADNSLRFFKGAAVSADVVIADDVTGSIKVSNANGYVGMTGDWLRHTKTTGEYSTFEGGYITAVRGSSYPGTLYQGNYGSSVQFKVETNGNLTIAGTLYAASISSGNISLTGGSTIDGMDPSAHITLQATSSVIGHVKPGLGMSVDVNGALNVASALSIVGGTVENTPIGAISGSTGRFTSITTTTSNYAITMFDDNVNLGTSDTKVPTQAAVKAYVDAHSGSTYVHPATHPWSILDAATLPATWTPSTHTHDYSGVYVAKTGYDSFLGQYLYINGSGAVSTKTLYYSDIGAAASGHTHDYSGSFASLTHASRHASGGADAITPASIGAAASSHNHDTAYVAKNSAITGATKAKITYDAKGLVTSGADLSASDIPTLTYTKMTGISSTLDVVNSVGMNPGTGNPGYHTIGLTFQNGVLTSTSSGSWHDQ